MYNSIIPQFIHINTLRIFNIFQRSAGKTRRVMSEYERMTSYTHTPNWFGLAGGPTARELQIGGEMLAFGAVFKVREIL